VIREEDPATLMRRADARWDEILLERPDLEPAVALQRSLVARVLECVNVLASDGYPTFVIPPAALHEKMAAGVPALRGETFPIPDALAESALLDFCNRLAEGGAGSAALHIRDALERRRLSGRSLLAALLARDQSAVRMGADQMGVAADLLWLIGELAVGPLANHLQRALFLHDGGNRRGDDDVALTSWDRGYCPACGSWPAFAEVCGGEQQLRCSFCGGTWAPASYRCTYCDEAGDAFITAAPDMERVGRRLELCGTCGGYLKVIEVRERTPFALLPIEDLATTDLDVIAMDRGYGRPPLRDLTANGGSR
jgi:FdhE protein